MKDSKPQFFADRAIIKIKDEDIIMPSVDMPYSMKKVFDYYTLRIMHDINTLQKEVDITEDVKKFVNKILKGK